jgi:hypothetical protein
MLKFIAFFLFSLISTLSFGQEDKLAQLDFDAYNFPKAVVINIENNSESFLKERIQNWIDTQFTETSLIETRFQDNTFYIRALSERLLKVKNFPSDLKYNLKISFRDGKYRFEVTSISYRYYTEFLEIANINFIKDEKIRKDLDQNRPLLSSFFNTLNSNLYQFIISKNSDW